MPNWIVSIVFLGIAVWRIKRVLKYRNQSIFLNEIGLNWIDRSRLSEAIRIYILIEILTFSFLPLFPIFSYIDFLHPYLWHIAIAYFGPLFVFALSWFFYYSEKKA